MPATPEPTAPVEQAPAPAPAPQTPAAPPPAPAPIYTYASGAGVEAGSSNAVNPVMQNMYDPTNPESGIQEEKGAARKRAMGTQQLRIELDPTVANIGQGGNSSGLQISK